jgi:hypothetical protein
MSRKYEVVDAGAERREGLSLRLVGTCPAGPPSLAFAPTVGPVGTPFFETAMDSTTTRAAFSMLEEDTCTSAPLA